MYLDPYEIAHVFCGNFSLFCFWGWGGRGGGYSKRSCPLVRVALISARSILYNVKKQLWCLIFSTRLHALRVRSFSFRSLFVFVVRGHNGVVAVPLVELLWWLLQQANQRKRHTGSWSSTLLGKERWYRNQTALTDVNMDVLRSRRIRITWFSVVVLKGKIDPCAVFSSMPAFAKWVKLWLRRKLFFCLSKT